MFASEDGERSSRRLKTVEKKGQVAVRDEHERCARIALLGASGFSSPDRIVAARELEL
jgi:hypothetical protein